MDADRIVSRVNRALARIDGATGRIEAAAEKARLADRDKNTGLEQRYASLQREAAEALQQLDLVIETLEK